MPSKLQDTFLVARLKKKDADAFAAIYDEYVDAIYRFIYFKVARHEDAEDITSAVFMKLWDYVAEKKHSVNNLRALLYSIARTKIVDFYRQRSQADTFLDEDEVLKIRDDRQQSLLERVAVQSDIENLEHILRKLKSEYREVILLHYVEELSTAEIAKILDKTRGAVRVLLHRAIKVTRKLIEESPHHTIDTNE